MSGRLDYTSASNFDPETAAAMLKGERSAMTAAECREAIAELVAATFNYVQAKFGPQLY